MKIINLEQGSEKWFEYKWGRLGGSTLIKNISNDKRYNVFFKLLSELRREYEEEDGFTSAAMERGTMLEPDARLYLSQYIGVEFNEQGVWEYDDHFSVSPDGANDDLTIACEIKSPAPSTHTKYIYEDKLPSEYTEQCLSYFIANKNLKTLYFISYCPEDLYQQAFIIKLERSTIMSVEKKRFKTLKDGTLGKTKEKYIVEITIDEMVNDLEVNINEFTTELKTEFNKIKNKF